MRMSLRVHKGSSGSCKNKAARRGWGSKKKLDLNHLQFWAEDKRCENGKSQSLTVGVRQRRRKTTRRRASIFWRAGCRAWHMFPRLSGLCKKVMRARILELLPLHFLLLFFTAPPSSPTEPKIDKKPRSSKTCGRVKRLPRASRLNEDSSAFSPPLSLCLSGHSDGWRWKRVMEQAANDLSSGCCIYFYINIFCKLSMSLKNVNV